MRKASVQRSKSSEKIKRSPSLTVKSSIAPPNFELPGVALALLGYAVGNYLGFACAYLVAALT